MTAKFNFKPLVTGFEADWPVTVGVQQDGGTIEEQTFMARFRTPPKEKREEIEAIPGAMDRLKAAMEYGLVGLAKSEDETLTPEMFELMWATDNVRMGLIKAYASFQTGSPAKN